MTCHVPLSPCHVPGRPFPERWAVQGGAAAAGVWRGHRLRDRLPADRAQPGGPLRQLPHHGVHGQCPFGSLALTMTQPGVNVHLHQGNTPSALVFLRVKPHCCRMAASAALARQRLRSAAQCLRGAQQKSMKQHTGQGVPLNTIKKKASYTCKQKWSKDKYFCHAFKLVEVWTTGLSIEIIFTKFPIKKWQHCYSSSTGFEGYKIENCLLSVSDIFCF